MNIIKLTNTQARRFILLKHGLWGGYRFKGSKGAYDFVAQCGCVQFDPIDVCGRNAELVFQSRVKGFTKPMLYDLLYKERQLVDYFDKNLAIVRTSDWRYFARTREQNRQRGRSMEQVNAVADDVTRIIRERGFVCSKDLEYKDSVSWYWSDSTLGRAALETMYFRGDLVVHHKSGSIKYYGLADELLPQDELDAQDPNETDFQFAEWLALRRIGAVGMLWNRPSDAWLCISGMKAGGRVEVFSSLINRGALIELEVEGINTPLYCRTEDAELLEKAMSRRKFQPRTELIAPLDNMMWDRKLIKSLFGFEYTWEIYTPAAKRKYGYYTLPLLSGERFAGRVEAVADRKQNVLIVKNVWFEEGCAAPGLEDCITRFAKFNDCHEVKWGDGTAPSYNK